MLNCEKFKKNRIRPIVQNVDGRKQDAQHAPNDVRLGPKRKKLMAIKVQVVFCSARYGACGCIIDKLYEAVVGVACPGTA